MQTPRQCLRFAQTSALHEYMYAWYPCNLQRLCTAAISLTILVCSVWFIWGAKGSLWHVDWQACEHNGGRFCLAAFVGCKVSKVAVAMCIQKQAHDYADGCFHLAEIMLHTWTNLSGGISLLMYVIASHWKAWKMMLMMHTSDWGSFVKKSPILPLILFDSSDMLSLYSSDSSRPSATCRTLFDPMQNLQYQTFWKWDPHNKVDLSSTCLIAEQGPVCNNILCNWAKVRSLMVVQ